MSDTWTHRHHPTAAERAEWVREDAEREAIRNPAARVTVHDGTIIDVRQIGPKPPDGEYLIVRAPEE